MISDGYQCWFCDAGIERSDDGAVMITAEGLWQWESGPEDDDPRVQSVFAHSTCAKLALKGGSMELEPHIFGERDAADDSTVH